VALFVTKATRFVKAMETGWTRPYLFECDDGNKYVIKFMSNPKGVCGLAKELIACRLGRLLDLPIVYGTVIYITKDIIDRYPILKKEHVKPGPHFGSRFLEGARYPSRETIRRCVNLHEAARMIVFDVWVNNTDRHSKNILITNTSKPKFKMIDHQCIFGGPRWYHDELLYDRDRVKPYWDKSYSQFVEYIDDRKNPFRDALKKLESCSWSDIANSMRGIPEEWGIQEEEIEMLIEYLYRRKQLVYKAIREFKPYFPKWRGK
jgi:hypothetical protein